MSEFLQTSNKEETVEVIDFRNDHIRDLFSENLPDVALQKLKNLDRKQNFSGYSRPFKLLTIPNQEDIDFLIKGNNASKSRWDLWEKLLSESNLNLEIIILLIGDLPEYKISRNTLFLPEFLSEKRIRIMWISSLNGIYWSPEFQNYPSALLNWNSESLEEAHFNAILKPLTLVEVFNRIFQTSKKGEIYNLGLKQAAFGSGYKKETEDILYDASKKITGIGNLLSSESNSFPKLNMVELYKGNLKPEIPQFKDGIFEQIDKTEKMSIELCKLFGATNNIISQDQIPDIPQRLEKSYKKYIQDILTFFKSMKTMHKSINKIFEKIDPEDGFDEEEYLEISKYKIDYHSSRPVIPTHERPIRVATKIFQDILSGIKYGNNAKEYKIILKELIKSIRPKDSFESKARLKDNFATVIKNNKIFENDFEDQKLENYIKRLFGNRLFKFVFNLPWTSLTTSNVFVTISLIITTLLGIFWFISTFVAGEPGDDPIFGSSGFPWLDEFTTNLFRNTQWETPFMLLFCCAALITMFFYLTSRYAINKIERVGRHLEISEYPETIRRVKIFLWTTLINDWVLSGDRFELISYLESMIEILDNIEELLSQKYLNIEEQENTTFKNRHLEPNPVLEINLNSVSENGVYKDFEGSVKIIKSDLVSLLEIAFDQEWMKIRGATGKLFVPKRIIENFKENLELFDKKMKNHPALDPNIALTPEGREEREKLIRNLWSEGDYPREKVLELMELSETSELVHFLNSEEVSLLLGRSNSIIYFRFAPLVLDLPNYKNFVRTKESKVAGVMRLVPMSFEVDLTRLPYVDNFEMVG